MYYLKSDVDAAAEEIKAGGERKNRKAPYHDQTDEGGDDDVDAAGEEIHVDITNSSFRNFGGRGDSDVDESLLEHMDDEQRDSMNRARRWCCLLDDLLNINFVEATKALDVISPDTAAEWNNHPGDQVDYSLIGKQLRQYCITDEHALTLFLSKIGNAGENTTFTVASKRVEMPQWARFARPIQYVIEDVSPATHLSKGAGWDESSEREWIRSNCSSSKTSRKNDGRTMSVHEASEAMVIYKTVERVKKVIVVDDDTKKSYRFYKMQCNCDRLESMGPTLRLKHRSLFLTREFVCSDVMMTMMPKTYVDNLVEDEWTNLPKKFITSLKKSADAAEKYKIEKIQTWQTAMVSTDDGGYSPGYVYNAFISMKGKKNSGKWMIIDDSGILNDFSHEPWIASSLNTLAFAGTYRTVVMGDGSKSKANTIRAPDDKPENNTDQDNWTNFWFCEDNTMKYCVEGAFANLLHHMSAVEEANTFRQYATMDHHELLRASGMKMLPKRTMTKSGMVIPMEKCLWLLRDMFNCRVTNPLKVHFFSSASSVIKILPQFRFPVVLSLNGTHSHNEHVIAVWNSRIIDFEHETTYPLTQMNLDFACGSGCSFMGVKFGCGLIPSRSIRKRCLVHSPRNWGVDDINRGGVLFQFFKGGS
jgi:hypothetical protein